MVAVNNTMLERRNLIRTFNELKNYRVVAVCAPAGYGKTVAIAQWLEKSTHAKAILSLDENDNSVVGFCERFCAALRACQPQNKALAEFVSHESFRNAPNEFALRAVSALSGRKQAVLVFDDLHLIHNDEVLQLLRVFIKRLPAKFQIILISRHDLPVAISELLIKGQAAYVSADEFVFTNKDIADLCKMRGDAITQEQAEDINKQTQGWAIGINAFLLSGGETSGKMFGFLNDFVKENIWDRWDETTCDFMLRTANLRELVPSLCEALTGVVDCAAFLKNLATRGAFVTQMQAECYRYHHLFQQFLISMAAERGEDFLLSLLDAEGDWNLSQMDFYSAVDCFIRSKNHTGIAKCFDLLAGSGNNNFAINSLLPVLKHPEFYNAAKKYPRLLFLLTFGAFANGRADDMVRFLDEYYLRHPEILANDSASAYKSLFLCIYDFRVSPLQMIEKIGKAFVNAPDLSISQWSVSLHMPMLHRSLKDYSEFAAGNIVENCANMQDKVGWLLGKEAAMLLPTLTAELLYERGNLEQAHEHAIYAMAEMKEHFLTEAKFCAMAICACILDAAGESEEAADTMQTVSQMLESTKSFHLSHNFNAFVVRREISFGNNKAAADWLATQSTGDVTLYKIYADFTTCRAHISIGKYDQAIILLLKILELAKSYNRPLDILEAQILLAIAYWKKMRSFQTLAIEYLNAAVLTAMPYNYTQMFINNGAELANILYKLQKRVEQKKDKQHINFIKVLYSRTRDFAKPEAPKEQKVKFTDRQKEIMHLLTTGQRHSDIAQTLNIKRATVCSHLLLIYKKLDVATAADAITKINAMGLTNE